MSLDLEDDSYDFDSFVGLWSPYFLEACESAGIKILRDDPGQIESRRIGVPYWAHEIYDAFDGVESISLLKIAQRNPVIRKALIGLIMSIPQRERHELEIPEWVDLDQKETGLPD